MEGRIEKFKKIMEPCKERVSSVALDWLIGNDFFIAPASINHHGAYTGARRPASTTTGTPREWHLPGL